MNWPRAVRHHGVVGNTSHHHRCQRDTVRALTPKRSHKARRRWGLSPCASALTKTTNAPKYTRRARNRTEAGVVRRRHPSRAQHRTQPPLVGRTEQSSGYPTRLARIVRTVQHAAAATTPLRTALLSQDLDQCREGRARTWRRRDSGATSQGLFVLVDKETTSSGRFLQAP